MTVKNISATEVEIGGEIPAEEFKSSRPEILRSFGEKLEIPGFRKGHVPEEILVARLGEDKILHEMAERALARAYPKIILDNKIDAIGRPEVTITKLAVGSALGFRIRQAVLPEIKLPDYLKISREINAQKSVAEEVTEKEIDDVLEHIKKQRGIDIIDDAFAKSVGNFSTLPALREKLRENILAEKQMRAKGRRREEIIEAILKKTEFPAPQILVEGEKDSLLGQVKEDLAHFGKKFQDYLSQLGKTELEVRESFTERAEKRTKGWMLISAIAEKEKIPPEKVFELLEKK